MTVLPDTDRLRQEALPGGLAELLRVLAGRPMPRTAWQVGPDGRLACRWDTDDPVAASPPH